MTLAAERELKNSIKTVFVVVIFIPHILCV